LKHLEESHDETLASDIRASVTGGASGRTMTLDMISTKTGREQSEIFMRQQAKRIEGEIRHRVQAESHYPNANKPAMQTTAITIRPLIMVNVSSSTLNIWHLIET
jgi:hypothetical protein